MRIGKGFKVTLLSTLNNDTADRIVNCGAGCIIIADMGASYLNVLDRIDADVIVLDHHKGDDVPVKVHYANPHSFGIDGMDGGCGASVAMLFSIAVDNGNWDLVQVAFAGIVGDKQHLKGLTGVNEYLFAEGKKRGYIICADGSLMPRGPLMGSLYRTVDPYIRGVSGNADGVAALLKDSSIDPTASADLNDAERRKLTSLISAKLLSQNVSKEVMEEAVAVRYHLKDWNIDAGTFASLLNSCGRSGMEGVAVGLGLGDKKCMSDAVSKDVEAQEMLVSVVRDVDMNGLEQLKNIQYFNSGTSGFTGTVCEILMRYASYHDKPTVGLGVSEGVTKASARCTRALLKRGADLSAAMKAAGECAGGGGGGHMIASGAWFPPGNENIFLKALDDIIGEQVDAR
jgi:RecJ-like exonuclease